MGRYKYLSHDWQRNDSLMQCYDCQRLVYSKYMNQHTHICGVDIEKDRQEAKRKRGTILLVGQQTSAKQPKTSKGKYAQKLPSPFPDPKINKIMKIEAVHYKHYFGNQCGVCFRKQFIRSKF